MNEKLLQKDVKMNEEQKPFEYIELREMCMMASAYTALIFGTIDAGICGDEFEARESLIKEINKIVNNRWHNPRKKSIKNE